MRILDSYIPTRPSYDVFYGVASSIRVSVSNMYYWLHDLCPRVICSTSFVEYVYPLGRKTRHYREVWCTHSHAFESINIKLEGPIADWLTDSMTQWIMLRVFVVWRWWYTPLYYLRYVFLPMIVPLCYFGYLIVFVRSAVDSSSDCYTSPKVCAYNIDHPSYHGHRSPFIPTDLYVYHRSPFIPTDLYFTPNLVTPLEYLYELWRLHMMYIVDCCVVKNTFTQVLGMPSAYCVI
jgi:hypothetical protein